MEPEQLARWIKGITEPHIVLGYGSLLSSDSRSSHSSIPHDGIEVTVNGFERGWFTRSYHEQQTYVGAIPNRTSALNAQLVPTILDPALRKREQDYRFTEVKPSQLGFGFPADDLICWLDTKQLWICETLEVLPASMAFPVSQTYIDTCMAGCLESGGLSSAATFVALTSHWSHPRRADRDAPVYPRAANVSDATRQQIDTLLSTV